MGFNPIRIVYPKRVDYLASSFSLICCSEVFSYGV